MKNNNLSSAIPLGFELMKRTGPLDKAQRDKFWEIFDKAAADGLFRELNLPAQPTDIEPTNEQISLYDLCD